jgi:acetylornithine deacetylase/succinyl-diaminopimelate desuccinylase-like protein
VADTLALCAVAAPTGAEERRAAEVAGRLAALGLEPRGDDVGNVLVRFGGDAPAAVVSAHLDTVFPEGVPLRPARDGDTLRGPGIGDDTVAVATLLQLAALLRDDPPRAPVVVAFTVGEEGLGDLRGIRAVLRSTPARALVAVEGHGLDTLVTGGVASARLRAVYRGPGGHSWADRGRPSAVHVLLAAGAAAVEAARGVHVNIGRAGGGISVNTIASEASLEVDLRDLDDDAVDAAVARVTAALDHAPEGIEARIEQVGRRPGGRLDADDPLRGLVRRARAGAGLPSAAERDASTEANAGYAAGVPSVCVGLTDGGGAHTEDEWIALGPLVRGVDALVRLVYAA